MTAASYDPSNRVVDQRLRNRIMEAVSWLAEGAAAAERMSPQEFFEMFYDVVDDQRPSRPWPQHAPETMTPAEVDAVTNVLAVVNHAVDAIAKGIDDYDVVVASGWFESISPVANTALELMLERGCFDEEYEEDEPSNTRFEALLRRGAAKTS